MLTSNSALTNFSESPLHLLTRVDADMLKKVVLHSEATAFARRVFPVPGGPWSSIPFQGLVIHGIKWYRIAKQKGSTLIQ